MSADLLNKDCLSAFIKIMPEAVLLLNAEDKIIEANQYAAELFAVKKNQFQGKKMDDFMHPSPFVPMTVTNPPFEPASALDIYWYARKIDGSEFPVQIRLNPFHSEGCLMTLVVIRDISAQRELEAKLKNLAQRDPLTGLINRPLLEDRITQGIALADRNQCSIAVFFIDIDNFKFINDTYGHEAGNFVLIAATECIQKCIREVDTLARIGGDEFALIILNINTLKDVMRVAKKIRRCFTEGFYINKKKVTITLSIGIAIYNPASEEENLSLLNQADQAMYDVKAHGKNNFKLYGTDLDIPSKSP